MATATETHPSQSGDPAVQAHYDECIRNGCNHNLAMILAHRRPPSLVTDTRFMAGSEERNDPLAIRQAVAAGIDVGGAAYMSQLADDRGPKDPEAWVRGRGDVRRVCEKRGYGCEGTVKTQRREREVPRVGLAEHLVEDRVNLMIAADPAKALKPREELKEEVRDKHTPHWAKNRKK